MWFFDSLGAYLSNAGSWFDYAGRVFDNIPLVGTAAGYPFHIVASNFSSCASACSYASTWSDGLAASISQALTSAQNAYNYAASTVYSMATSAYNQAQNAYNYAATTVYNRANDAWYQAQNAYNYAASTVYSMATNAYNQAQTAYNYAVSVSGRIGSDAWSYIQSGRIQAYLDGWKNGLQASVLSWVGGAMDYLITTAFNTLASKWTSFNGAFVWLLDRLIILVFEQAAHFTPLLWSLFETVVSKLTEWSE